MSQWIEVQARYEKLADNGAPVKVTDPYLVDALSCTEAEARVVEEITPFVSGEFNVLKVSFWDKSGDRFYKAKLNFITIVEDTKGVRTPEYIIKRKLMLQVHGISIKEL